ncbi:tRNA-intron endonuclease catalytic domain-like protein [Lactarius psammicola]|nr:tRNA-intron endonuclease catalytic domain-like protein [Lactarius psammicola]
MSTRIPIHVSNQTAFVWDVDHVATLRSEHRICGVLTGTLPHLSQQNLFLGLPLVLVPEELVLLVEKQLATIVHDPAAHHPATPTQLESWDTQRKQGIAHQIREAERRKGEDRPAGTEEAAAQKKRAERDARRRRQLAEAAEDAGPIVVIEGAPALTPRPPSSATTDAPSSQPPTNNSAAVYTVSVPTTSDAFAWYAPATHTYETLDAAREAGVWTYPATEAERARCEVFRDLWEKGYYLGGGGKFGGDWLVYPGDPLRYHSHFVATVQTSMSAQLRPMEIVAHGRLGTATKKAHLLCGWDPASREVTYISVEWAGFG